MMAGYECALCGGEEPAALLITPLTGGETMPVGESCMAVAFTGMLAGHLGVDADKLWAAAERLVKKAAAGAAKQASEDGTAVVAVLGEDGRDSGRTVLVPSITQPSGDVSPREDPARRDLDDVETAAETESVFVRVPHGTPDEDGEAGS